MSFKLIGCSPQSTCEARLAPAKPLWRSNEQYNWVMSVLFPDTRPEAEAVLIDLLRNAPSWRKLEMVDQLNHSVKLLVLTGLKERYPDETETQLRRRLAGLLLGEDLACKAYGSIPG